MKHATVLMLVLLCTAPVVAHGDENDTHTNASTAAEQPSADRGAPDTIAEVGSEYPSWLLGGSVTWMIVVGIVTGAAVIFWYRRRTGKD